MRTWEGSDGQRYTAFNVRVVVPVSLLEFLRSELGSKRVALTMLRKALFYNASIGDKVVSIMGGSVHVADGEGYEDLLSAGDRFFDVPSRRVFEVDNNRDVHPWPKGPTDESDS